MSGNRYYDDENQSSAPRPPGDDYTDRFRLDSHYDNMPVQRGPSLSSASTSGPTAINRMLALIRRACRPSLSQPDLALNLEIADIINNKKGNAPRAAAVEIVKYINDANQQVAVLALGLLDICVKNCGYPFHLQISRKEFLNELVKRFPERPPVAYSRPMLLILEAIEEWRQTIAKTSKYKSDLGYIRDMHRLLSYKGYMFPEVNRDDAAVLTPADTLRSAAELEQEEREAQAAKLEELIRRGTPADLREANHLMAVMAGFKDNKTDYRARASKELDKIRRKAELLEEMLNNAAQGEQISDDDVFSEIIAALKSARPKIEKMIDTEGEQDPEALTKLLGLNDYIHALIEKYDLLKQGNWDAAQGVKITQVPGTEGRRRVDASSKAKIMESLIDIDDDDEDGTPAPGAGTSQAEGGAGAPASTEQPQSASEADLIGGLESISFDGSFGAGGNVALSLADTARPGTATFGQRSRQASPAPATPPTATTSTTAQSSGNLLDDDFFSSPAPETPAKPRYHVVVLKTTLGVEMDVIKEDGLNLSVNAVYLNNSPLQPLTDLNFQMAVPKGFTLRMEPQSSSDIAPRKKATQKMHITRPDETHKVKLRWRVTYKVGANSISEDGIIDNILE